MNLKKLITTLAPTLASAIGGPHAGTAVKFLAGKLFGKDDMTEVELEVALGQANPEQLGKLRQIDNDFKIELGKQGVQLTSIAAADRANARGEHKHSPMPAVIVSLLTLMVAGGAAALFMLDIPEGNREISYLLFGTLLAKWGDSIAYWVGTTRGSAEKNKFTV